MTALKVWDGSQWIWVSQPITSLDQLADVTVTSPATGKVIRWDGAVWRDAVLAIADISGLQAALDAKAGGADLLSGLGVPANSVGAAGDFYFDDTNDVLYGPKGAGTGLGTPFWAQGANTPDTTTVGDYRLGATYQVLVDGQITSARFYRDAAAAVQARTLTLYENGVLVATSDPTSETATAGWVTATFPTPFTVTPGREYTVAYRTPSSGPYVSKAAAPAMTDSAQVAWVTGRYDVGTAGFPSIATGTNFFLDLEFEPSATLWPLALESGGDPIAQIVPTEPADAVDGLLWYDSDDDQFLVDVSYVQDNEPTGAVEGALWLDTDDPAGHTDADHTGLAPIGHTHPALTLASTPATSPTTFPDGVSTSYWDASAVGTPADGSTWTVETAKWTATVIHQTVSRRDGTPEGDEDVYFRTGYQGGTPEWGPWQRFVTDLIPGGTIKGVDGRGAVWAPSDFGASQKLSRIAPRFHTGAELGLPGTYYAVETIAPWGDDSGGGVTQIARNYGQTWERYGLRSGAWGPWRVPGGGWNPIATVSPSGASNVVGNLSFLNIPTIYKRFRIRSSYLQFGTTNTTSHLYLRFNSDTGSTYVGNLQYAATGTWSGTYSTASSTAYAVYNYFVSGAAANQHNWFEMEITNNGIGQTQWRARNEGYTGTYTYRSDVAGQWLSTAAITRIDLWASSAYTWNASSVVTLEGSVEI